MIHELFQKDRPVFVRFDNHTFRVGRRKRDQLEGIITDMLPMRKRFEGKRLVCWANAGLTGKDGQRCALCRERWGCAERVRLMLLLDGLDEEPAPAILEIGHASFDALEEFARKAGDDIARARVCIRMQRQQGRLRFTFEPAT